MKKRYILMAVTAALVFAVAAGGTLAAQQAQGTTAVGASLEAPRLSILWNSFRPMSDGAVDLSDVSPGGYRSLDETYSVYNQGNVPAYVRVTVTKYWGEPTGEVDEYGFPLYEKRTDLDSSLVTLNPAENDGWMSARKVDDAFGGFFSGRTKSETQVFYFSAPLQPGEQTGHLLESLELATDANNDYANKGIILEAEAEGVQFVKGDNELNKAGILSAWGVNVELDENGNIVSISD